MHSKSTPILINTVENNFFTKTLLVFGVTAVGVCVTYYLSSALLAKISSLSVSKLITLPKVLKFGSILANLPFNLPFVDKTTEISVFIQEISTTVFIELINNNISNIMFKQIDDDSSIPITEALKAFIEFKKTQTDDSNEILKTVENKEAFLANVDTVAETLDKLSDLF